MDKLKKEIQKQLLAGILFYNEEMGIYRNIDNRREKVGNSSATPLLHMLLKKEIIVRENEQLTFPARELTDKDKTVIKASIGACVNKLIKSLETEVDRSELYIMIESMLNGKRQKLSSDRQKLNK